ncbi:response regulator [Bacteroides salyersiae]|uniref:hybrid sensor histidine kinase/response regulator transcription factor n=1 Tax=Bacteroides salyersiae TaxID=291644 RepID=UPI0037440E41|nr:response regulator [Bacteroides salyersiae]
MKTRRVFIFCFFLILYCSSMFAGTGMGRYAFRSLDINNGLSQNTVAAIIQDRFGFMWFGTKDGLNRYDGVSFQTFMKESGTLGNNFITSLYEDCLGQIWIGTDVGVYIYSPSGEKVERFVIQSNLNTTIEQTVHTIKGDRKGRVWIVSERQGIFCYDTNRGTLEHLQTDASGKKRLRNAGQIVFDQDDVCWLDIHDGNLYSSRDGLHTLKPVFSPEIKAPFKGKRINKLLPGPYNCLYVGTDDGLMEVNLTSGALSSLLPGTAAAGESLFVREMVFYSDDVLWIGTESGIYVYNSRTGETTHLQSIYGDSYSISDNAVYAVCKDREGGMWVGTWFGGVNYYPRQYTYFEKFYPRSETDRMGKRVREFCADRSGTLWIGTEDRGLFHFNPVTRSVEPFKDPLIYQNIHGLCLDDDALWVGTFSQGLNKIDLRTRKVKHYAHLPKNIFSVFRTTSGQLYLGTPSGLISYDSEKDTFSSVPELSGVFVYYITEDKQGNLWLATYVNGVYRQNIRTKKWEHFVHDENKPRSLPSNKVLTVFVDSENRVWLTTQGGGFCRFDPSTTDFTCYDSEKGLPSNVVYRIEEDNKGLFWISTNKGLLCFNPKKETFKVYTRANGLLDNQFNYQSSYKDENGNLYFGSINGFISFDPSTFISNDYVPPVVITDFMLFNKRVTVGDEGSPLKQSITLSDEIVLKPDQNSFSFRVAALAYHAPEMNTLMYKLEGYDSEWRVAGNAPITYSHLPFDTYRLMVKGANSDGLWNPEIRSLEIRVLPPFYLSTAAYVVYILLLLGLICSVFFYFRRRGVEKHRRDMEKFEQEKERELYISKIEFFTNVAHEIRTPLTLIKSPLESVLKEKALPESIKTELEVMDENAERLLALTNQLLDFRKTGNKGFKLNLAECNMGAVIHSVYKRFIPLARKRGIDLKIELPEADIYAGVDKEAIIKVLSNLFSNALKYAGTYAHLYLSADDEESSLLIVMDNDGEVIPLEMRDNIFLPFVRYRDGNKVESGTGIGLALARSLAELHGGSLVMDRSLDCNRFIFSIPIVHCSPCLVPDSNEELNDLPEKQPEMGSSEMGNEELTTILVVEDNKDMLSFLQRQFAGLYHVLVAGNGVEALSVLSDARVSLVITDIMMPEMDGLELCEHLKSNLDYSHIPVVLLTAKTAMEQKIEGLEHGADVYIEKPFSVEYLRVTVANLLKNREQLCRHFMESPFIKADTIAQSKADKQFISKLEEYVARHLENPDLSVDDMAGAMNMGRSNFFRKLKGVLGIGPNEYLRLTRLKKAAALLQEKEYGIVEIAYMVGFSTPSYFSSCFKKQFGVLPKDFV